ncbi:MAG: SDR family NAD(P)-dependent oxidoreductase [Clostridia bacterium]|nr:SDR family NAD(P)-dependent oxidoreductase [Clostridia bacterium]
MKNILISGVCGGMGNAAAKLFSENGYAVYGIDICDSCEINGVNYAKADLSASDGMKTAKEKFSGLKFCAIIHFAGIYNMDSLIEMPDADFEKIFRVNVFGAYRVNKAFFDQLEKGGRIILTSSELAPLDPLPFTGIYGITKTAVEKYADALRMELNLLGVKVSVIRPGAVSTSLLGVSTAALDRLCDKTELYPCNAERFRRVVNSVENKSVPPEKVARLAKKAVESRRPKYVYNLNRNFALRLLSAMPKHFQVWIISKIISDKKR